jgi:hypothetical protein
LPVGPVVDPLDCDLPSPHIHLSCSLWPTRSGKRVLALNNTSREVRANDAVER